MSDLLSDVKSTGQKSVGLENRSLKIEIIAKCSIFETPLFHLFIGLDQFGF